MDNRLIEVSYEDITIKIHKKYENLFYQAMKLRKKGNATDKIAKILKISKETAFRWCAGSNRTKYHSKYYKNNIEKESLRHKKYRDNNQEKISIYNKQYSIDNKEKNELRRKKYNALSEVKNRVNKYHRNKACTDIQYKLKKRLRIRLNSAIRGNYKIGSAVKDLGCSIDDFKLRLEMLWTSGMSWKNYGEGWHLDHIIPLSYFDLTDRQQFLQACNFTNIQPLWAKDNLSKGNKILLVSNIGD